jgi:hypothetical protein
MMASSSNAVPRTTRESPTLATTMRSPLLDDVQRRAAALHRVQAAAAPELVVHSDTCGHVGLFLEVELAVAKFLLIVNERPQRECLLLMVFVDLGIKPRPEARNPKYPNPYPFSPKPGTQIISAGNEIENPNLVWA